MFIRRAVQLVLLLAISIQAWAQPVPPPVGYPLKLERGGTELNNTLTNITTTGTINNQALTTSVLRFGGGSAQTLTGIVSNGKAQRVLLINFNSSGIVQLNNESGSSTAANRFSLPGSANYTMPYNTALELVYDTVSSRWRVAQETLGATSPLYKASGSMGIYQATTGQNGYLSASDYSTYLDNWKQTGNDIYATNAITGNVWIAAYNCATLTTYSACAAKTGSGCSISASGDCSAFNGNEAGCLAAGGASQCSWNSGDSTCSGSYFQSGDCSNYYYYDDGSSSSLQVKAKIQCSGSSNACSTYNSDSTQCANQGCSYSSNTCPSYYDESSCNSNSPCSWTNNPQSCAVYNSDYSTCTGTSGCAWNECSGYNADESTCVNANAACSWSTTPCSTYNGDQYNCENSTGGNCTYETADCSTYNGNQMSCEGTSGCTWSDPDCTGSYYTGNCTGSGFGGTCSGTWCSGSYDSYSCGNNNESCTGTPYTCASRTTSGTCTPVLPCTWSATPAGRFQGDLVATDDGYLEFEKTSAGAPTSADCDADAERGRLVIDTTNNRLYVCNGASRGWDYTALTN